MFDPIKVSIWMFILYCNIIPIVYYSICWRLNIGFPPKLLCWHPIPNVMPLGSGAFGGRLGREGGALGNGISALIKQASESPLSPPPMWGPSQRLGCEPRCGFSPVSHLPGCCWPWTSQPPEPWETNLCGWSATHSVVFRYSDWADQGSVVG